MEKTLTPAEQKRRELAAQSGGLLREAWLHGHLWTLKLATDPSVTVSITSGTLPYRVTWVTSGDKKIGGKWETVDYTRSRSFGKIESLLEFLREF